MNVIKEDQLDPEFLKQIKNLKRSNTITVIALLVLAIAHLQHVIVSHFIPIFR